MPDESTNDDINRLLRRELGLDLPEFVPEEEIIAQLAKKVEILLRSGQGAFFQLMYRLDVAERDLSAVLDDAEAPHKIARLVYDRQLEKIESRKRYKPGSKSGDKDLEW
jgi:hypothetical protein